MNIITFTVPGVPVAKARPRLGKGRVYTPKRTKDYEARVRLIAFAARVKSKQRVWTGPVGMSVVFRVKNPTARPDLTNLLKGIEDACNGIIYVDDSQIVRLSADIFSASKDGEGVSVFFWEVDT